MSGVVLLLGPSDFCSNLKIKLCFSSAAHPQANGQVEVVNKLLKRTLKKKLEAKKGAWSKLLPEVLWVYRCTERTSTEETPYSLAFRVEAVILIEVGVPTHRVNRYTPKVNVEQFSLSMVLLEEHRLCATHHLATY